MSNNPTYNFSFPLGCDGKSVTPGCFPCRSDIDGAPVTSAQQYVVSGQVQQTSQPVALTPFSANGVNYTACQVTPMVPINGVKNGLVLYFSMCQSPCLASIVIMPQNANGQTTLTSLYSGAPVDAIRISLGDSLPFNPYPVQGHMKSISWGGEGSQTPFSAYVANPNQWAFVDPSNTSANIALVEANITPYPSTFVQVFITPAILSNTDAKQKFRDQTRLARRDHLQSTTSTFLQTNVTMQAMPFQESNDNSKNSVIFSTNLTTPPSSIPSSTIIDVYSYVQIYLVWASTCNVVPTSIYLYSQAGAPCVTTSCTDGQQSPPNVWPVTSLNVPPTSNTFAPYSLGPGKQLSWANTYSYRTSLLCVLESFYGGPLPSLESVSSKNLQCLGMNILVYTGSNNMFSYCEPYDGTNNGVSTSMLRCILGGAPGSTLTGGLIPGTPSVQIPNLTAICTDENALWQVLTGASTAQAENKGLVYPPIPSNDSGSGATWQPKEIPSFCDWVKFFKYINPTASMQNIYTLDVSVIELPVGGTQQVFCVIRCIPYVPPPAASINLPAPQPGINFNTLPQPIPINATSFAQPQPIPTLVMAMGQSPFPLSNLMARNVAINCANFTQSGATYYASSFAGVPGMEFSSGNYSIAPPILKAATAYNTYVACTFASPSFSDGIQSLVLYTVPIPQVVTSASSTQPNSVVVPCLRLVLNSQSNQVFSVALTDGNDSFITAGPSTTTVPVPQSQVPSGAYGCFALFQIKPDYIKCFLWIVSSSTAPTSIPKDQAPYVMIFPYNPFTQCNINDTVYMYSHTTGSNEDFMGTQAMIESMADLSSLGTITSFPCPTNLDDPTYNFNLCMINAEPTTGFLLDQKLDPLALVGVFDHTSSAYAESVQTGEPVRAVVKRRGERWDEMTKQAKEASVMSFAPTQMLLKTGKTYSNEAAQQMLTMGTCPNGNDFCAPAYSSNAFFNYNYNSIATICPLPSTLDGNVTNCLLRNYTCDQGGTPLKCNPDGAPSVIATPRGQCGNPNACDVWLQTAPNMSRSCLNATIRAASLPGYSQYLGPYMPYFMPDPSSCAFPQQTLGDSGCPALSFDPTYTGLCYTPMSQQTNTAMYTSTCYNSSCEAKGTQCTSSYFCDSTSPSNCYATPGAAYSELFPCQQGGPPSEVYNTAYCTPLFEQPTTTNAYSAGLFPFAQLPCASNLTPVPSSSFPATQLAQSNQITCPNTTADEASWFQTIFSCQAKQPPAGNGMNYFGQTVIPPPIPGDSTGGTVSVGAMCGGSTKGAATWSPPANWPWTASCVPDANGNSAVLFTLATSPGTTSSVNPTNIYAQACLDPGKIMSGVYDNLDPSQPSSPVDVQLSYCINGDTSGSCSNTAAQFLVTYSAPYYQAVGPAGATTSSEMIVCGQVQPGVWGNAYGQTSSGSYPAVSDMTTMGIPTDAPAFAMANMFTNQSASQYVTTGQIGTAVPVYLNRTSTSSALPSGVKLAVSSDVNLTGTVPINGSAVYQIAKSSVGGFLGNAGVGVAQALGITPWTPTSVAQ